MNANIFYIVLRPLSLRSSGPTIHWSDGPQTLQAIDPMTLWSYVTLIALVGNILPYILLVIRSTGPTTHWSYSLEPWWCTAHWSYEPLVLRLNSPWVSCSHKWEPWCCTGPVGPINRSQDFTSLILSISANFACAICEIIKCLYICEISFVTEVGGGSIIRI